MNQSIPRSNPGLHSPNPAYRRIDLPALDRALSLRDLSDPSQGPHAMQALLSALVAALESAWSSPLLLARNPPIVSVADNYDRLHYDSNAAARDSRYARYLSGGWMLRSHTTAGIPQLLRTLSATPPPEVVLACPGLVYRRDAIDRVHVGEPHQVDLWRIRREGPRLERDDLLEMIDLVVHAVLPGVEHRVLDASHPYTVGGLQIELLLNERWLEIGECGLALPELLRESGWPESSSGLAMGLGLDRLLMLKKSVDDIRLLRAGDPRVADQMLHLDEYRPVSAHPAVVRDLSIAVDEHDKTEELGDRVRSALGAEVDLVESVTILSETPAADLPPRAIERIGLEAGQKNVLVRVVLRHIARSLTHDEANRLRDAIYAAVHQGTKHQWASRDTSDPKPSSLPPGS